MDDDPAALRTRLRIARSRLDEASPHGPDWEAASEQVAELELAVAAFELARSEQDDDAREAPA